MANPIAVATARAQAEERLALAAEKLSERYEIRLRTGTLPANRYPELAAADLVDRVAEFLEQLSIKVNHGIDTQQAADSSQPRRVLGADEQEDRGVAEADGREEDRSGATVSGGGAARRRGR